MRCHADTSGYQDSDDDDEAYENDSTQPGRGAEESLGVRRSAAEPSDESGSSDDDLDSDLGVSTKVNHIFPESISSHPLNTRAYSSFEHHPEYLLLSSGSELQQPELT